MTKNHKGKITLKLKCLRIQAGSIYYFNYLNLGIYLNILFKFTILLPSHLQSVF